jgi:hypothetical protein
MKFAIDVLNASRFGSKDGSVGFTIGFSISWHAKDRPTVAKQFSSIMNPPQPPVVVEPVSSFKRKSNKKAS